MDVTVCWLSVNYAIQRQEQKDGFELGNLYYGALVDQCMTTNLLQLFVTVCTYTLRAAPWCQACEKRTLQQRNQIFTPPILFFR